MKSPSRGRRDLVLQYPGRRDPALPPGIDQDRYRGYAGGLIALHRSLVVEPRTRAKSYSSLAILVGVTVAWALAFDWVTLAWAGMLDFLQAVFGMGGYALRLEYEWGLRFPYLGFRSGLPGPGTWMLGALLTAGIFIASLFVPRRFLPIASGLRVVAFFQACAQVFFAFWPEAFPYDGAGYVHGMLIAGLMFISVVPLLLGFTYHVFDFGWRRKLGLTLVVMLHLALFVPLQFMAHALIIHHLSVLFLPLLFFVFGLPLNVLIFIGFYGWGMSWKSLWQPEPVLERRAPPAAPAEGGVTP
jgi:hypothetical protein